MTQEQLRKCVLLGRKNVEEFLESNLNSYTESFPDFPTRADINLRTITAMQFDTSKLKCYFAITLAMLEEYEHQSATEITSKA